MIPRLPHRIIVSICSFLPQPTQNKRSRRVLTSQRHNKVERNQHQALHIVALAVLDEEVDEEHRDEEDDGLKVREEEREVVVRDPADDNE